MFTFTVTPDDGDPYDVTAGSRDVLRWERTTKGKTVGSLSDAATLRMEDLFKLAWVASTRFGLYTGSLADFESTVDVEMKDDEDEGPDPTPPTP